MKILSYFSAAIFWGVSLGFAIGHLDIVIRIAVRRIEWFEVYLSLMLPAIFFTVLFLLGVLCACILAPIFRKQISLQAVEDKLTLITAALFFLGLVFVVAHFLVYGDFLLWEARRVNFNAGLFIGVLLLVVFLMAKAEKSSASLHKFFAPIRKNLSQYVFFIVFFVLGCFGYDLYLRFAMPEQGVEKAAEEERLPNVVFLVLDTVRARNLASYGYDKETAPFLSKLASESALFEKASAMSSWTLPSHASMFTGKYSFHHGAHETYQKLRDEELTLAEVFGKKGYRTAGFVGGPYVKGKYGFAQGFQLYLDRLDFFEFRHTFDPLSIKRFFDFISRKWRYFLLRNDGERTSPEINKDVFRWLDRAPDYPFFLFINYFDAHDPYDLGLEYREKFTQEKQNDDALNDMVRSYYFDPEMRYKKREVSENLRDYLIAMYDTEIYFLDKQVEALVSKLESIEQLTNTIIIVTSDHGEEFFEHGGVMHKQTLYEEVVHVPLLIYYPSNISPVRVAERVSHVDIMPTLLELLGYELPDDIDGQSLLPYTQGLSVQRADVISQRYGRIEHGESALEAITGEKWKYIQVRPEQERMPTALYDLENDASEENNLKDADEAEVLKNKLKTILEGP